MLIKVSINFPLGRSIKDIINDTAAHSRGHNCTSHLVSVKETQFLLLDSGLFELYFLLLQYFLPVTHNNRGCDVTV